MPAPTAVRTQASNLLNMLWDAIEDGSAFDTEWAHQSVLLTVLGRPVVLQITVTGERATPYITLMVKRL